jgi:hypothetical protein
VAGSWVSTRVASVAMERAVGDSFAIRADPVFAGGLPTASLTGKTLPLARLRANRPLCHFNHVRRQDRDVRPWRYAVSLPVAVSRPGPFNIFQQSLETAVNSRAAARTSDALFLKLPETDSRAIS